MAVIDRTECFSTSIRRIQGIVLILGLLAGARANPQGCDLAKSDVAAAGFPVTALLDRPTNGPICGEESCCGNPLEEEMSQQSRLHLVIFLRESILKLSSLLDVRARKFDSFFREMMNNSKREFHAMFQKTYGKIYLQNSDVFSDFFVELETYYKKGTNRLTDTLETFFGILYQRMFTVINSQYTFDEKYLECVAEHMVEMKPFGDVPSKLSMQLRRSFVATRTYYKALALGGEVVKKMSALKLDENCEKELTKMQYCGRCRGQQGAGACSNYCVAVLETCLSAHVSFNSEWDNMIEALDKVADRLVGPFNIEMVVEPLNIKISEAIMNFQESGTEVSKKIYLVCGKPTLTRRKRKASIKDDVEDNPNYEIKYDSVKIPGGHKKKKNKKVEEEDNVPTLEKLIKEIKTKVRETRQFWAHLPYQYCNNATVAAPPSENGKCWNGTSVGDFSAPPKQKAPPRSTIVSENIYSLQMFSDKLRKAHQGDEVEIVDDSDEGLDSGSGSGSGEGPPDEDGTDEPGNSNDDIVSEDDFPVEVKPPGEPTSTDRPDDTNKSYSSADTISLSKALVQYLLPIVLAWFGGAISDLL